MIPVGVAPVARRRRPVASAAIVAISLLLSACIGGPGNLGVAYIRNESPAPATVTIDQPSHAFLGGTQHLSFVLPPWQEGWCSAFGYGINEGAVTIAVTGPSVPFPTQTTINVTTAPTDVMVLVDADGAVHFSNGRPPPDKLPCQGYPQVDPTASGS